MKRTVFISACILSAFLSACTTKEDPSSYKWREEWKESLPEVPDNPPGPDNPDLPEIK